MWVAEEEELGRKTKLAQPPETHFTESSSVKGLNHFSLF